MSHFFFAGLLTLFVILFGWMAYLVGLTLDEAEAAIKESQEARKQIKWP